MGRRIQAMTPAATRTAVASKHQQSAAQEVGDESHGGIPQSAQPAPIFERSTSDFMRKAPSATTTCPGSSPCLISTHPAQARPTATGRRT